MFIVIYSDAVLGNTLPVDNDAKEFRIIVCKCILRAYFVYLKYGRYILNTIYMQITKIIKTLTILNII